MKEIMRLIGGFLVVVGLGTLGLATVGVLSLTGSVLSVCAVMFVVGVFVLVLSGDS